MRRHSFMVALVGGVLLITLIGCVAPAPQVTEKEVVKEVVVTATPAESSRLEELKQQGFVYLGYFNEPPWAYVDEQGDFRGVDVDVSREAMKCVGIPEVRPVPTRWEGLIPAVLSGRFEAITTGMIIKPEREEVMIHSQPMWKFTSIGLVKKGNPLDLHSLEDIRDKGAKFGYVQGGYEGKWAEQVGVPLDQTVTFQQYADMISALRAGRIDVIYTAELTQREYLRANPDLADELEIAEPWEYIEESFTAHWFHPDNVELRDAYDACITKLKKDGTVQRIAEQNNFPPELMAPPPE